MFRNVGIYNSDAGELPRKKHTTNINCLVRSHSSVIDGCLSWSIVLVWNRLIRVTLTLNPLTWKIWWAPNNASRWQMGFNSAFKLLTQEIFNFPARHQRAVKCKMALTSQQRGWCVLGKMTRCSASGPPEITGSDRLWLFSLGVREGQSLCTSTTRNRGWAAGRHHCSCQLGHAGYVAESLVWARLSHRCLPSNKRGAHWVCVIPHETVSVYAAESLVRARLSHRCLPSNKRGAHWVCVIPHETVSVYATVATNFVRIFQ